ncbi:MAG TPA: hypothetical protein VFO10_10595 [Oligoflexus sp.]|uniref:hypothetical protein n=1 Tax=Oligoflexus sp. TaxID=1971216 RepID=UPI002D7ED916|nr:hypothetical protein [Oligoflexus sp.]HET9237692.1 hypothetical protein [Oligoflexus sp.]
MHRNMRRLAFYAFIPISLTACQNEPPAFIEQGLTPIILTVSEVGEEGPRGSEFIINDEEAESEAGAQVRSLGYSSMTDEESMGSDDAETADDEAEDDSVAMEEDKGRTARPEPSRPVKTAVVADDAAGIAAACGRHLKGFATRIRVISAGEALTSLNIGPDTAIAVRLTGRQSQLSLNLGAGHPLAGICFVMRGHESFAQFTTASDVKKLVYLAAGDESKGDIQISEASLGSSRIEMSGHSPGLSIKGVSASHCSEALLKNKSARIQCTP